MRTFRDSVRALLVLTVLTGVVYPLMVTGIAKVIFPAQAAGSWVAQDGRIAGSALIGQPFHSPHYFWSRPSATSGFPYNASASSGSNLGPFHPDLAALVAARMKVLQDAAGAGPVPIDLVTASGSGLDPHISPASALYQVARVAAARGVPEATIRSLVERRVEPRQLGVLGEPRVNVLLLNLDLDRELGRRWSAGTTPPAE